MLEAIFRTLFFYFFILLSYRIMGKREIAQLGVIDLIVSIMIAEISAFSIERTDKSILFGLLPIISLVVLELILGFLTLKSRFLNKVFEGKPTMIINKGKLMYKNLITQRYSIDDLLLELRKNEISSIDEVEYALLETNGDLSIFKYKPFKMKNEVPLPLIIEGVIQDDVLKDIKKSDDWLQRVLDSNALNLEDIFYAIYKKNHLYVIKKS